MCSQAPGNAMPINANIMAEWAPFAILINAVMALFEITMQTEVGLKHNTACTWHQSAEPSIKSLTVAQCHCG